MSVGRIDRAETNCRLAILIFDVSPLRVSSDSQSESGTQIGGNASGGHENASGGHDSTAYENIGLDNFRIFSQHGVLLT